MEKSKIDSAEPIHRPDLEAEDMAVANPLLEEDLSKLLDEDSVVIDIGANIGQFAQDVLNIESVNTIYSFEPVDEAFATLEEFAGQNPQIIPFKKAVSLKNGTANFFITASDVGSSLLPPIEGQPSQWLTLDREVTVETVRLDSFIDEISGPDTKEIALLKSDSQGADLDVILSAGNYLNPKIIKAVLVEINFSTFYQEQQNYHEIFAVLEKAGYRMARFYSHRAHDGWLWWADVLFIGK